MLIAVKPASRQSCRRRRSRMPLVVIATFSMPGVAAARVRISVRSARRLGSPPASWSLRIPTAAKARSRPTISSLDNQREVFELARSLSGRQQLPASVHAVAFTLRPTHESLQSAALSHTREMRSSQDPKTPSRTRHRGRASWLSVRPVHRRRQKPDATRRVPQLLMVPLSRPSGDLGLQPAITKEIERRRCPVVDQWPLFGAIGD